MKILISPAKTFRKPFVNPVPEAREPQYGRQTEQLRRQLKDLTLQQWQTQFHISEKAALENVCRMNEPQPLAAALWAFNGEAYKHLNAETLDSAGWKYCEEHLRILSAFYGLLNPLDLIQPYRLDPKDKCGSLIPQTVWKPVLSQELKAEEVLILASREYAAMVDVPGAMFVQFVKNGRSAASMEAKKLRGTMARRLIDLRVTEREAVKSVEVLGYRYQPALSTKTEWVFAQGGGNES